MCDEAKLEANLKLLRSVGDRSGAKVLCALKGFAFSGAMPLVAEFLDGATSSGLHESKYAASFGFKLIHTYSPAFKDAEFSQICALSDHVVFNSFSQFRKFRQQMTGASAGIRVNPQTSFSPVGAYDPCSRYSRLGVIGKSFEFDDLEGLEGLHFHALCEQDAQALKLVVERFEAEFGPALKKLKWVNFGGGHHITKAGYDVDLLVRILSEFGQKYGVAVYIEPGEAVGWQCGHLVATILDVVENEQKTCIIDVSAECHMPDTILMPYAPQIRGAKSSGEFAYRFGGATCLAGDVVGLAANSPLYYFDHELKIGDEIIFEDQIHYSIVKNTTFNGIALPDLVMQKRSGELEIVRQFGYEDYARRN